MIRLYATLASLLFCSTIFAQAGDLDLSFDGSGFVITSFGSGDDVAQALVVQPDGKIILAGYAIAGSANNFALVRYNVDGSLDNTFSSDGKQSTDFSNSDDAAAAVVLQPDGKILVAGYATIAQGFDFALARYLPNGTLDNSFSGDGKVVTDIGGFFDKAFAIALQPDGKVLVGGTFGKNTESDFAVVRYNTNGTPDGSFGQNGIATLSIGPSYDEVRGMALQPDGKIVLAGFTKVDVDYDFALARMNSDGTPDAGFGTNGKVVTPVGNSLDYARGVTLQADGKILVTGYTAASTSKYDFALLRYLSDGTLDQSFNGNGIVTTAVGESYDEGLAIGLEADGKILTCGYSYQDGAPDLAMVQYGKDGVVDSTFGLDGIVTTPIGSGSDQALALGFAPGNKVVLAGRMFNGTDLDFVAARYLLGQMSGLSDPNNAIRQLLIAPNPLQEQSVLAFDLTQEATLSLALYNLQGNLEQSFFQSEKRGKGQQRETLHFARDLPAGVHMLVLQNGTDSRILRVVKQ